MLELAAALLERLDLGEAVAVATVTRINGSAPRTLGTAMAVDERGAVIGSISGGCVEGAVYEACLEVLASGEPVVQEFGYSDDDAFAVGLACGGRIEVIVLRLGGAGWGTGGGGAAGGGGEAGGDASADGSGEGTGGVGVGSAGANSEGAGGAGVGGAGADGAGAGGAGGMEAALRAEFAAAAAGRPAGVALVTAGAAFGALLTAGGGVGRSDGLEATRGGVEARGDGRAEAAFGALLEGDGEGASGGGAMAQGGAAGGASGELGGDSARRLLGELAARVGAARPGVAVIECEEGPVEALFVVAATPPRMIVFGAVDFSGALASAAALLGYRVTICDARPVFATAERFPAAAEVVVEWPSDYLARTEVDGRTALVVLTHDDKFDIPLLQVALGMPVAYVGAMGSRRTHDRRLETLRPLVSDEALARLHSPIGLDIGASTPEETAVSILAEIIAARHLASGAQLRAIDGPIHRAYIAHAVAGI